MYAGGGFTPETKKFIGDFDMKKIRIDGYEVTALWRQLDIYETLDGPMTATLDLIDTTGFIYKNPETGMPLLGGERVVIEVDDETYKFRVFKISNRHVENPTTLSYRLSLYSDDGFNGFHRVISKSFIEKRHEDVIRELHKKMGGSRPLRTYEKTREKECLVIPNFYLVEAASMIAARAESLKEKYRHGNYLFFENIKGWHFIPYEYLLDKDKNKPFATFSMDTVRALEKSMAAAYDERTKEDYITIDEYQIVETIDTFKSGHTGMFNNSAVFADLSNKNDTTKTFDYERDFGKMQHTYKDGRPLLGTHREHVKDGWQRWDVIPEYSGLFTQERPRKSRPRNWYLDSRSLRAGANFHVRVVTGLVKELYSGATAHLRLPQVSQEGMQRGLPDPEYSGRYLITELRRTYYNKTNAFLTLHMVKDSLGDGDKGELSL